MPDELDDIPVVQEDTGFAPLGTPITAEEVAERLSENLYAQLSEKDDQVTLRAVSRAEIYVGSLLQAKGVNLDLDNQFIREIVLIQTVRELHIALGHMEAAELLDKQFKNAFLACFGAYPDADTVTAGTDLPLGVLAKRKRHGRA